MDSTSVHTARTDRPMRRGYFLGRGALGVPGRKRSLNTELFAVVAPRYDRITQALSLGRDAAWKRLMVSRLPALASPICLDLACGTGEVTDLLGARYPGGRIEGMDLVEPMLRIARSRCRHPHVRFTRGDMMCLRHDTGSVDVVTGGYAIRNAPDLGGALDEIARVLRPGGVAAFLDFARPKGRRAQVLAHVLLSLWGGFWGLVAHGRPDVYRYIAESLREYPDRFALRRMLTERGLRTVGSERFYGGITELIWALKTEERAP